MSLLDFSKNCDITTRSFSEDLLSYSLKDGEILWSDDSKERYTIKKDIFAVEGSSVNTNDFWTPIFCSDDDLIDNKLVSHYGSIIGDSIWASGRIGIENFITFKPKFKSWNVNNGSMVIDWILNRSKSPFSVEAGLMYWKRKRKPVTGKIDFFPIYSKIKYNNIEYIKLDNDTLRKLTAKQNSFNANTTIDFNYTNDDANILVSSLGGNNIDFTLVGSDDTEIWIPDGDQLLYFTNQSEKKQNNIAGIAARSYISGSLYKYYNIFYNSLTAGEKLIKLTESRSVHRLRQYKKLAHSLSTSPFSSEFFVSLLSKPSKNIQDALKSYLEIQINSITKDIEKLNTVLEIISREYSVYELQNTSNIVKNKDQLFSKLFNKYGAKLQLVGDNSVNYKPQLTYGDSVIIEEIGETLVSKDKNNTVVTNNKTITVGNLSVTTNIGETSSNISLKHQNQTVNTVHLYNSVKPEIMGTSNINILMEKNTNVDNYFKNSPSVIPTFDQEYHPNNNVFYWGPKNISNIMNDWRKYCPKLKVINADLITKYTDLKFPNQAQDLIDNEFFCTWTKVSGPNLKFVDLSKTETNKNYNVAYGDSVIIVPSSTGKYVIKCVISSPYGSYTKIKTIFVVDGRENIDDPSNPAQPKLISNRNFGTYSIDGLDNLFGSLSVNNDNRFNIDKIDLETYETENAPIFINKDRLKVFISGLDSFAIHRNGLYAPIRTNYYVERVTGNSRPIEKLNVNYIFTFDDKAKQSIKPKLKDSFLIINYFTGNTVIKLDRIILKNIRNETKECSQCYSLYQPKFRSFVGATRKPFFSRSNKNPQGFNLQKYLPDTEDKYFRSETQTYSYPVISSDISPPISSYGGYGYEVLDKLAVKNLDSLTKPENNVLNEKQIAALPNILPSVTGYKLDYKDDFDGFDETIRGYKFCYQENVMPEGHITFNKGTFVPNSGWVVGDKRNLSNVLKFNPGARKSFSFSGPGILGLSNYTNSAQIQPNTFSSSIELNINSSIHWDNGGAFCPDPGENAEADKNMIAKIRGVHNMKNQLNKELADQYIGLSNSYHHGYRILNGGNPKNTERNLLSNSVPQNDEFNINIDENSNKFIYSFNVVGPHNKIGLDKDAKEFIELYQAQGIQPGSDGDPKKVRDFIEKNDKLGIRNPRINDLTIKDVEIQLNFLNYVNTKNLVIWLEVEFSKSEKENMKTPEATDPGDRPAPRAPSQIKAGNNFIDQFIPNDTHKAYDNPPEGSSPAPLNPFNQFFISDNISVGNNSINNYLKNLTNLNSRNSIGDKVILYLLNQETIQNKDYNFSLKFSDSANKHNVLYDQNLYTNGIINPDQNIISNNQSVSPSKSIDNYDTFTNSNYSNLNKLNRLNINNNTFHKLVDRKLFHGVNPRPRSSCNYLFPPYDSSTKFTLHISILEEEDEMFPIDNITNNELYTNIASVENSISCANLFNNLCSWELILHTEDAKKPVTSQVNSLANYGGTDSLSLIEYGADPQYPGYSFVANLKDSKFLLPLVNMNAPTTFFQNYNSCEYADNELIGKGTLINAPRFPTEALLLILAGTAVGGMSGTLVGTLVGGLGPTYAVGFELIFAYYAASRQNILLDDIQREVFDIEYESYPFGNSDKILLNISKDGIFWYKVEASIFKLSNTPALPLKQYKLIKSDNKLFKFNFDIVNSRLSIIDDIFIPYIVAKATPDDSTDEIKIKYQNIDDDVYNTFNFMSVNELIYANKLIHSENIFQYINQPNQTLIIIDHAIPYNLISVGDTINLDCENKSSIVMSKALIYKDAKYQTVLVLNRSQEYLGGCSSLLLPEDVVIICGDNGTTIESSEPSSVPLFGLVSDQPPNDSVPDLTFSTNSLGSYGDGSSVKDKNILSRKVQINNIDSIYNQLNSFNNDKYYYNELSLILPSGDNEAVMAPNTIPTGVSISIKNQLESYPVYYDTSTNNLINNDFYHIYDNTFNNAGATNNTESIRSLLDNIVKDNRTYSKDRPYNMIYLKVKNNDTINKLYRNALGSLTIENNYTYNETVERITQDQLTILINRLGVLNKESDTTLDTLVGNASSTARLLQSDSIFYIQQHYDLLPDDLPGCSKLLSAITCYKDSTYSKLQKLYNERNEILRLLQKQTIKDTNNAYTLDPIAQKYHTDKEGIIPDQKANITTNADKSVSISYEKVSDDYYWINIDPRQSISIAEEMRPKVLKSIEYKCQNTNPSFTTGGIQLRDYNNICADGGPINNLENNILKIEADTTSTKYIFKDNYIEQQKNTWTNVFWSEQTIERQFRINADKAIKSDIGGVNQEFLVTAIETYEIALDNIERYTKAGKEANLSDSDIISVLIEENIIKNDYSGDVYGQLKRGADFTVGKPTRVYNIFNLDDTEQLQVQFRKVPRTIRGIDAIGTILRYGENISYRPQNRPPLDPLEAWGVGRTESLINNFYQWKCLQKHPITNDLLDATTPEFFQLLNEMVFRTFFGSVDNIENKTSQLRSLYDFEMIPYEYFTGKPPIV